MSNAPTAGIVFARRMREVRDRRNWTQQDLADRLDEHDYRIQRGTLAKIEAGGTSGPVPSPFETRARNLSLEDALAISVSLAVSPLNMIADPHGLDFAVQITPKIVLDRRHARAWIRGQAHPVVGDADDTRTFHTEVPHEEFMRHVDTLRGLLVHRGQAIIDAVQEAIDSPEGLSDSNRGRITDAIDALNEELDRQRREDERRAR